LRLLLFLFLSALKRVRKMPKKPKTIKVERPAKDSDTLIEVEFTDTEWALVNAYFDQNMNQTRAYLSVFKNAQYDSARVEASKFFAKPTIRAEIKYRHRSY